MTLGVPMAHFAVDESRMLYFHRVLLDQARRTPNLVLRAVAALPAMRDRVPGLAGMWREWDALLAAGLSAIEAAILADTAQAGLLRANSPLAEILDADERNALWQRVGLQQLVAYYLAAVTDLGLSLDEEAAITGLSEDELAGWADAPPPTLSRRTLDALKTIIAVQRALAALHPVPDQRQAWLRQPNDTFPATPLAALTGGDAALVQQMLAAAVQPGLSREAMPSH